MSFFNLKLIEPILKALSDEGYTTPTPIQEQSIPIILSRRDLLGCAQTGTGKTAAFAIPLLQLMYEQNMAVKNAAVQHAAAQPSEDELKDAAAHRSANGLKSTGSRLPLELKGSANRRVPLPIKALILTPTRELAIQIDESFANYGKYTGLKHLVIFGGVPQHPQVQALQRGIDILVATPGRLLDLIDQRYISLSDIQFFVLDEADRMLDMGFVHDVRKIIARLPQKRQTLFFSATMPPEIQKLASTILTNPEKVEVTPVSSTAETIQQTLYFVEKKDKRSLLLHVLKEQAIPTALVFTRTKHGADKVAEGLNRAGIRSEAIHGNKSQNARQRALLNFKSRQTRVLVATDIAARGIDIDELTHVINFELPNVPETYVHRIGRTGRAGASGIALSFCDAEEKEFLDDIQKLISRPIPVSEDHPFAMQVSQFSRYPSNGSARNSFNGNRGNSGNQRNSGSGNQRNGSSGDRRNSGSFGNQRNAAPGNQRNFNSTNNPSEGRPSRPIRKPDLQATGFESAGYQSPGLQSTAVQAVTSEERQRPLPQRPQPQRPAPQQNTGEVNSGLPWTPRQSEGDERL
ncbi:DEAD/DEAH box helicase [Flavitalea flava]